MIIEWRKYPVVSERFGKLLGHVTVPGEPAEFHPSCTRVAIENSVPVLITTELRWDPVGRRYIAPSGFPVTKLQTFELL